MEAYLDNSATTRCLDSVIEIVEKIMREDYGNPSSKHQKGLDAENYVRAARTEIAQTLKVQDKEIFFTSGGTESNNWALIGSALANRRAGNHLITTAVEHAAVLQPMGFLEEMGFRITYLPVDNRGPDTTDGWIKRPVVWGCIFAKESVRNLDIGSKYFPQKEKEPICVSQCHRRM